MVNQWALDQKIAVTLLSPSAATGTQGLGWWGKICDHTKDVTCILDCAHHGGLALEAMRNGVKIIALDGDVASRNALKEIAEQIKVSLVEIHQIDLDLLGASREGTRKILSEAGCALGTREDIPPHYPLP